MEKLEKYGPQTGKIQEIFDAFSYKEISDLWGGIVFDQTYHFLQEDWQSLTHARSCVYDAVVKAGREEIWKLVFGECTKIARSRYWGIAHFNSILALSASDLVGSEFTQKQLDLLLGVYNTFWDQVGNLFELTQAGSPERDLAIALFKNANSTDEAISTSKRTLA